MVKEINGEAGSSSVHKGIIYYTSHNVKPEIFEAVQKQILKSGLPIISSSLKPINFGDNVVYHADGKTMAEKRGIMSYFNQILLALEVSNAKYVFFCEHDVLYHPTHFDFEPPEDDVFYYNTNVWKWDYIGKRVVTYDQCASVSGICVNRKHALEFYRKRMKIILDNNWDKVKSWGNPSWARHLGYEPGRAGKRNKLEYTKTAEWRSEYPIIDIRHTRCMTIPRWKPELFKNRPKNWREDIIDNVPGWNIYDVINFDTSKK